MISRRLLKDAVTIRKPVQSMVPGTKKPVYEYQTVAQHVPARFNPLNTDMKAEGIVVGRVPKKRFRLFINPTDLKENYEVVDEANDKGYLVVEVKDYFGHHLEAELEERKQ